MHKKAQQAAGGPTSLVATSKEGAHLQLSSDTRSAFFTPDSSPNELIIVLDDSEKEKEVARDKDTEAISHVVSKVTLVLPPPSPKSAQIQELIAQVHLLQSQKEEFATMVENASTTTSMNVLSAGEATASPAEGEKNTKDADTNMKDELVDLLGKNVVT
uniref:Uncharacterized protein n=1 Tax=Tanacetum cinerariifolium TaxID=118510 RepID=A0A6L2N2P4_TANCI|nr:hypothetical protein [Tanacetum cinerariifolium]GEU79737.1 hypothetical protein [Tanacetum cinerariifolium]